MTTIHRTFVCDSNGVGRIPRKKISGSHVSDSVKPSVSGVQGLKPSTTGMAQRNTSGRSGNAESGPTEAQKEAARKAGYEKGVRHYNNGVRITQQKDNERRMSDWMKKRIDAHPLNSDSLRNILES